MFILERNIASVCLTSQSSLCSVLIFEMLDRLNSKLEKMSKYLRTKFSIFQL